jgi:dihydropyrimidinase
VRLIVKGGTVATAEGSRRADVLVEDETILEVGERLPAEGALVADASGCLVLPGGVDVHTHVALDIGFAHVSDGFRHGTLAAAMGGTTCIVEHPGFGPAGCALSHQIKAYRRLAGGQSCIDYAIHGVAQSASPEVLAEVEGMARAGCPSLKAYMTYAGKVDEPGLLALLAAGAASAAPVLTAVHCEDDAVAAHLGRALREAGETSSAAWPRSRPDYAEALAVREAIALARAAGEARTVMGAVRSTHESFGAPLYIVHLSTASGLAAVKEAQAQGQRVIAETCPQYLLLDESVYSRPDGLQFVMAPPLRRPADREALWRGLAEGSISTVGTDHCSFSTADKTRLGASGPSGVFGCPGGVPGVQTRMPLMFTFGVLAGRITLERFVDACCTAPARIMGLSRKGRLEPGFDADILVLNPDSEREISAATLSQRVDYTPFEGMRARGWPRHVLSRGTLVVRDGAFSGAPGHGRFVKREITPFD